MELSNREIASVFWFGALMWWGLRGPKGRSAICALATAFRQKAIILTLFLAMLYCAAAVIALRKFYLWDTENLKTTIVWFFGTAAVAMFDINSLKDRKGLFKRSTKDLFVFSSIILFIIEANSFALSFEIFAVPLLFFLTAAHTVSTSNRKLEASGDILKWLLSGIFIFYVSLAIYDTAVDIESFLSVETMREYLVPFALSVLFVPFLFGLATFIAYESVFSQIDRFLPSSVRTSARWLAIVNFRFNIKALQRWSQALYRQSPVDLMSLRASFAEMKRITKAEAHPPPVAVGTGWSPYAAKDYLAGDGLQTGNYDRAFQNEWQASSSMLTTSNAPIPSAISYYVEGEEDVAKELKLRAGVADRGASAVTEEKFTTIGDQLLVAALPKGIAPYAQQRLAQGDDFDMRYGPYTLRLRTEAWVNAIPCGYSRTLSISVDADGDDLAPTGTTRP